LAFEDLRRGPIRIDLFDALDYKLMPSGFYLQNYREPYVNTTWEELAKLPVPSVLSARLRTMEVPKELRDLVHGYWITENQYGAQL